MNDTTPCTHCGEQKPPERELCPHCQKRSVAKGAYNRPRFIPGDAIKEGAEDIFIGVVLVLGGIALVAFIVSRYVSC